MRALAFAVLVGFLLVGVPSDAATPCPTNKYCVWADSNGSGPGLILGIHHHRVTNAIGNQLNDAVSSAENETPFAILFYEDRNGKGSTQCLDPGQSLNFTFFNDVTSSSKVTRRTVILC